MKKTLEEQKTKYSSRLTAMGYIIICARVNMCMCYPMLRSDSQLGLVRFFLGFFCVDQVECLKRVLRRKQLHKRQLHNYWHPQLRLKCNSYYSILILKQTWKLIII